MTDQTSITPGRAGRREWIGLIVIALPCLLYSMDLTVLHLAVPELTRVLAPSSSQLLWIIDIYGFMVAGTLIIAGTLGDRIGRRRILLSGAVMFGAASVLAAYSTTAEMLIVTRAILGIAGATVAPSTLSLIRNMFHDPDQRRQAVSVWIMAFSLGGAIGPLIGGVLLQFFWWGSVFLIAVPVMLLLLAVGPKLLPEYKDPNAGKPDITSAGLSLAAILSIIYGLKRIAESGASLTPILFMVGGLMLALIFVRRQMRLDDPLIDLRLFKLPSFSASLATYGLTILVMFGGFLFLPQYLQLVLGLTPLEGGLWTLPWSMAFILGSTFTPALARRFVPANLMAVGLAMSAVGYAMVTRFDVNTTFAEFAFATFVLSIGVAPVFTLTTDLIIGSAPAERAGAASAMSETSAEFGGALGIAVFGSIGVAVYRTLVPDAIPPGLDSELHAAAAGTLGGAAEVAERLSAKSSQNLLAAARGAFVRGLHVCAWISAAASLGLSLFAFTRLRNVRGGPAASQTPEGSSAAEAEHALAS